MKQSDLGKSLDPTLQAVSDRGGGGRGGAGGLGTNRGETFYPCKGRISPQGLRYIPQIIP
jgi:hypothetical protein